MKSGFVIEMVPAAALSAELWEQIAVLCSRLFETDYRIYMRQFHEPVHLLGLLDGELVSHALWIDRWLQIDDGPLLKTAFVEAVVTEEAHQGKGYAKAIMRHAVASMDGYQMAALAPGAPDFYAKLGWEHWQGPLAFRGAEGLVMSPEDEETMIYRLPGSPPLDLSRRLSVEWRPGDIW